MSSDVVLVYIQFWCIHVRSSFGDDFLCTVISLHVHSKRGCCSRKISEISVLNYYFIEPLIQW